MTVRVLIVEDEEIAALAHAEYVGRVDGFEVAGVTRSAGEAMRHLRRDPRVDLVLLDMHLPDGHGLGLLQSMRSAGILCDVIAVTPPGTSTVRQAVSQGVVQYLLKPFTFAGFRSKLLQYAAYRERLGATEEQVVQEEVDELIGLLRTGAGDAPLPKGMSADTLREVTTAVRLAVGCPRRRWPAGSAPPGSPRGATLSTSRVRLVGAADPVRRQREARGGVPLARARTVPAQRAESPTLAKVSGVSSRCHRSAGHTTAQTLPTTASTGTEPPPASCM